MTTGRHTPTPWRYGKKSLYFAEGIFGPKQNGRDANWIADTDCGNDKEREANAQFIVTAVNCHDEMLAALEQVTAFAESVDEDGSDWLDDPIRLAGLAAIQRARIIIAKARGSAK